jgi:signal transduction histidine kinase
MTFESNIGKNVDAPPINRPEHWTAEQSARAAQRLSVLGEMTGGIAHDFRNILAVIDSGLQLTERNVSDPDRVRAFVAGAREGVVRGLRLTSQLLTFARQKELPTSAADVNALLVNLELFLKYGAGPSVRIDFLFSANLPKCVVARPQFATAILNLVINARDAMPRGGTIQITTTRCDLEADTRKGGVAGAYVRVRVKDNGLGMTEDVANKIFEPFFTTKGENGTGLGIPQVCAFMRHVGGRLNVESEVGRGTTFDLFFPAVEGQKTCRADEA